MWGTIGTIVGGALGGLVGGDDDKPETPEQMSWDKAYGQAKDRLSADFEKTRDNTMDRIDNQNVSRGFYGQAAGDALKQEAKGQMQADYQQNLASLASNIQQRNFNNDMQKYKMEQQEYAAGQQGMGQMIGGIAQNADWGQAGDVLSNIDWGGIFGGGGSSTTSGGYQGGGTNTNQYDYMS